MHALNTKAVWSALVWSALGLALVTLMIVTLAPTHARQDRDHNHETTSASDRSGQSDQSEREVAYWVAPMDSNYRRDEPGKSPMGMDLVPVYADELTDDGQARVSRAVQQTMNLRTDTARRDRLWRRIDTVGSIQYDESRLHHVHPRVEGWIQELDVAAVGDAVRAGQRLFTLYSPELVNAQEEFLQALRRGEVGLVESARRRLEALDVQPEFIERLERDRQAIMYVPWHARHDGVVTQLNARHGMFVARGTTVLEIADLSTVWLIAEVFDRHAQWLDTGQPARLEFSYRPGQPMDARIDYIYPELDPTTRAIRTRMVVENGDGLIQPGMWTGVRIFAGPVDDQLIIPREALIRTGQSTRVVVHTQDDLFEVREVVAGMESGNYVAIRDGLAAGEEVVTSGQFLIDSEASLRAGHERTGVGHDH